jgi:hypothetical protein
VELWEAICDFRIFFTLRATDPRDLTPGKGSKSSNLGPGGGRLEDGASENKVIWIRTPPREPKKSTFYQKTPNAY